MNAIIFDFDGVLVDSEHYWHVIEDKTYEKIAPRWTPQDHHRIVGMNFIDIHQLLTQKYDLRLSWDEFLSVATAIAKKVYEQCTLTNGAQEFIESVQKQGIKIAIASSSRKEWICETLKRLGIAGYFSIITGSEDLKPGEGKPKPTIYLHAAERLKVEPQACIVIEDAKNGVLAAKAAGMYCIGFRNGVNDDQDLSKADRIIHSFKELDVEQLQLQ